jgi:hypothetical protein
MPHRAAVVKPPITPSDKMKDAIKSAIMRAWLANAETIYPRGAEEPDAEAMAEVAALSASAAFCEWINTATGRDGPN